MFEEAQVCMLCGRPVDGQVYCSDECEALDAASPSLTSPSLSTPSSAYASPYLASAQAASDVPALLPSVLGHRAHHSISSSNSSAGWTVPTDHEDEEHDFSITVVNANTVDQHLEMLSEGPKSSAFLHPHNGHGLLYARRPSSTNHRSIVPLLLRHSAVVSTNSSSSASSFANAGLKGLSSPLYTAVTPDNDDASSLCLSDDLPSEQDQQNVHPTTLISSSASTSTSASAAAAAARRKRNRASLPAYFSLLQGQQVPPLPSAHLTNGTATDTSRSPRHWRTPSALQQISKSLHGSPTTPRVAYATATFAHSGASAGGALDDVENTPMHGAAGEKRRRGRPRTCDPEARSTSRRRECARSRSRPDRHHVHLRHHDKDHAEQQQQQPQQREKMSAAQRARIDSVEKVAKWVSSSPVILGSRPHVGRRNSSPQRAKERVRSEFVEAITRGLRGCAVFSDDDDESLHDADEKAASTRGREGRGHRRSVGEEEGEVRGRRRVQELDRPVVQDAPGLGSGRSGIKYREEVRGRSGRR